LKKILPLLILILFSSPLIFSQNVELGFEAPVQLKSNEVGEGNGVNFSAEYIFDGFLSLETTLGGISDKTTGKDLASGTYSMFWAEESAGIKSTHGIIEPYCGIGLGYYKTDINLANTITIDQSQRTISDNIQYSLGYNLRGGIDVPLGKYFKLNAEIKYIIFDPSMTVTNNNYSPPHIEIENVKLNAVIIQAGAEVSIY